MTIVEWIKAFAHDISIGIVVTDAAIERPGPIILYANPAFGQLVGRDPVEIVGQSPRFMQGKETRRETLDAFHRTLSSGERFHGYVTNYRGDGAKYRAEIDCRPLRDAEGGIQAFISFEREVVRRVGRPAGSSGGRYEPSSISNDLLPGALRGLGVFAPTSDE
ncbi:PAS domain-containing protein [Methylobacterium sp. WL116]|uniref:PAS domain-containing protein n=1 Tax=Methylobacterium sp. WL116 TaxID=2603889 RepID=UPI0011C8C506|nr:PAS domain-containing protein [Methylobacterium sp. WL116]TXM93765.1 PAS domain-containing protein [Methylobacterium sp. WL116]